MMTLLPRLRVHAAASVHHVELAQSNAAHCRYGDALTNVLSGPLMCHKSNRGATLFPVLIHSTVLVTSSMQWFRWTEKNPPPSWSFDTAEATQLLLI